MAQKEQWGILTKSDSKKMAKMAQKQWGFLTKVILPSQRNHEIKPQDLSMKEIKSLFAQ